MSTHPQRETRFYLEGPKASGENQEFRSPFERDYDRLVHSSALRRLANVTQVVNPAEGHVFHNRLTHTLKVAQIARRLAQRFQHSWRDRTLAADLGGLDPNVVESAALAHDLGHPPFGHIAEKQLNWLVRDRGGADAHDGYEGNAAGGPNQDHQHPVRLLLGGYRTAEPAGTVSS